MPEEGVKVRGGGVKGVKARRGRGKSKRKG